jgi:7-cyano-7-deazaguanine synthase in queuosine biosynthesis
MMGEPTTRQTLLLNLSGGVDSTFAAWRLLSDGWRLLLHHCEIQNREGRKDVERQAVTDVVRWLRDHNLRAFSLVTSGYDHGTIGRLPFDVEVIGFLTGVILRDPGRRRIRTVVVSANAGDVSVTHPTSPRVVRRREVAETMAGRPLNWWVPYGTVTKRQMIDAMPPDLFALCWWCRRPRDGKRCGRCRPCRDVVGQAAAPRRSPALRSARQEAAR